MRYILKMRWIACLLLFLLQPSFFSEQSNKLQISNSFLTKIPSQNYEFFEFPAYAYACGIKVKYQNMLKIINDYQINGIQLSFCDGFNKVVNKVARERKLWFYKQTQTIMCPQNYFMSGIAAKFSWRILQTSTFVGLKIICKNPQNYQRQQIIIKDSRWGVWKQFQFEKQFISAVKFYIIPTGDSDSKVNLFGIDLKSAKFQKKHLLMDRGYEGDWKNAYFFYQNYFGCGAQIKFEDKKGKSVDDTAAHNIKFLVCDKDNWEKQNIVEITSQKGGQWKGMKTCPKDYYISGYQARIESMSMIQDNTGFNGLKLICRDKNSQKIQTVMVYEGEWGQWKKQKYMPNKFMNGFTLRIENDKITLFNMDKTALNGIAMYFEQIK